MKQSKPKEKVAKRRSGKEATKRMRPLPHTFQSQSPGDTIFELAFLKTHARTLEPSARRTITGRIIYRRLCALLHTNYINPDAPPGDYIKSAGSTGSEALRAFTQVLGRTDLTDEDYAWFGFTEKINLFPFSDSTNDALADRIRVTGTKKHYWDVMSGEHISNYLAEVAYNLDASGSTSISLNYENGTRKETRTDVDQIALKLNYKY